MQQAAHQQQQLEQREAEARQQQADMDHMIWTIRDSLAVPWLCMHDTHSMVHVGAGRWIRLRLPFFTPMIVAPTALAQM